MQYIHIYIYIYMSNNDAFIENEADAEHIDKENK